MNTWVGPGDDSYDGVLHNTHDMHEESFQEWIDEGIIKKTGDPLWVPPPRDTVTGKRVSLSDDYKPIALLYLNWRWWLAEYPMRMLARYMSKTDESRELRGEEYVGTHTYTQIGTKIHEQIEDYNNQELGPE